ncbi:glycoside hydrolase family 28 protein [Rheinheimera sediminis]|uniref:glycoside hydrolase family 28 protein n=1 Tax=Rheinheimera sp. YQF-1 TaxID=2499626 RepID=UPI001647865A|nr:glycoside hydrolase family 28 protein [Rheinheimera sp. YQF-1]
MLIPDLKKRFLLKACAASAVLQPLLSFKVTAAAAKVVDPVWAVAEQILRDIKLTSFPQRDFVITAFGAKQNQRCDKAIAQAIAACHQAGGGRVVVPEGVWSTGPVHLKSNVNLHLQKNAVLSFVTDPQAYLPAVFTRWEGVELMGFSPLIYAYQQQNIAVTGEGILEGNASGDNWWPWKGVWKHTPWKLDPATDQKPSRDQLFAMAEAGVPVEKRVLDNNRLRPPFIQPYGCERVLIEGVTIRNSPFWLINPVLCKDVVIRGVNCVSFGPNSDGCDPESCQRVLIENCLFDTGDDCIALKSGRNAEGRRLATPIQQVVIQDCLMKSGHGGVVIGSEISGGAKQIFARRCRMSSPNLERGLRIKTNSVRGGLIEQIAVDDIEIGEVKDAIVINFYYEEGDAGNFLPEVKDLKISNFRVKKAQRAFEIRGLPRAGISGIQMTDVSFEQASLGVLEHSSGFKLENVSLNGKALTAALLKQSS